MRQAEAPCCEPLFWAFLTISLALLSFAGITSGLALGLLSLNQVDLEVLIKAGQPQAQKNAAKIMPLVKNEHLLLCTLLIGKTLAMEALPIFVDSIFPTWAAILISGIVVLAFVEIIPQAVCSRYGLSLGAKLSAMVRLLALFFFPLSYPISKLLDLLLGKEHFAVLRRAELKTLVALHANEAGKGGELSHHETSIIAGALDLTQKTAIDAMTPISETFSLDINSRLNMQMMGLITSKGHSRIPVYSGDQKNIIGLILVKNLIFCHPEDETPIKYMTLRRMPRVYDNLPLYDILNQFLKGQSHMAIVVKSKKDIKNVENNALVKSDMFKLNLNPNLDPKEAGKKGLIFPLAEMEQFSFSTEASPLYSSETEIQSATLNNVMKQDNNFQPQYEIWQQGGEIISAKDLESLPSNLDEEVIGIITMEDVLEALLQENILDETDAYIDVHNKIKINPQYSRILASGSPKRSSSSRLRCRNSDPSALSAYSHTPERRSHSFSYVRTPIIRSTLSPSLTKSMNNSQPASAITPLRSAPSSHRLSRMSYEKLELPGEPQSP